LETGLKRVGPVGETGIITLSEGIGKTQNQKSQSYNVLARGAHHLPPGDYRVELRLDFSQGNPVTPQRVATAPKGRTPAGEVSDNAEIKIFAARIGARA